MRFSAHTSVLRASCYACTVGQKSEMPEKNYRHYKVKILETCFYELHVELSKTVAMLKKIRRAIRNTLPCRDSKEN